MKKKNLILTAISVLVLAVAISGCASNFATKTAFTGFNVFNNKPAPNKNLKEYTADLTRNNFKTYHFLDNTVLVSKPIEYFIGGNRFRVTPTYSFYKISRAYYRECKNIGGQYKAIINKKIPANRQGYSLNIFNTNSLNRFVIAAIKNNEKNKFKGNILLEIQNYKLFDNNATALENVCSRNHKYLFKIYIISYLTSVVGKRTDQFYPANMFAVVY